MWQEACPWSPAVLSARARKQSHAFARMGLGERMDTLPRSRPAPTLLPSCSPPTRATAAGPGFCWRRSPPTSPCCGSRTAWRSSKAGASIRRACPSPEPHPRRGARRQRRAVGDGGGRKMRRALGRDRRIVGRPARARLHRDAAAGGRVGAQRHAVLAGAARRHCEFHGARMRWRMASRRRSPIRSTGEHLV